MLPQFSHHNKGFINYTFCRYWAVRNPAGTRLDSSLVNKQVGLNRPRAQLSENGVHNFKTASNIWRPWSVGPNSLFPVLDAFNGWKPWQQEMRHPLNGSFTRVVRLNPGKKQTFSEYFGWNIEAEIISCRFGGTARRKDSQVQEN